MRSENNFYSREQVVWSVVFFVLLDKRASKQDVRLKLLRQIR